MAKQQDFPGYLPDSHRILWLLMRVGLMIWGVYGLFHGSVVEFLQAIFAILFTHMWDYFQVFGGRSFITRVDYISGTMLNVFIFLGVVIGTTLNNRTDFKDFDIVTHFFASILSGIEDMAVANGYFVIITTSHESYEHEKRNIENLVNMRVEGIIACLSQETTDYSHWAALTEINMPLILFDRVCLSDRFSTVVADGAQSAQAATQHLLDTGSRRVAFIGGANHLDIVKRRKHGYLEALRENHIPIEKELVVCRKIDYEEGKIATESLLALPQPPDAILAMNDTLAFAAMEVIKSHGLRIPQDVALIGYTDEQHANYVEPKLSAVCHQTYQMGQTACQLLIDRLKGDKTVRQVVIPTTLQVRESSVKEG